MSGAAEQFAPVLFYLRSGAADDAVQLLEKVLGDGDLPAEPRSLALHATALLHLGLGHLEAWPPRLSEAARVERAAGFKTHAHHTSHEISLMAHADREGARRFYEENLVMLKKMKNVEGLALCGRSLGEMALVEGRIEDASSLWTQSADLFSKAGSSEGRLVNAWLELIAD